MTPDIEALRLAFATNTNLAEWAALAVFIGLVGDIAVLLTFDLFDKNKSWWEIILAGFASAIIAGGVWGESHFGQRATNASSQLQARLYKEANDARLEQEQLRAANLILQKELLPRHVDVVQHGIAPLKALAGTSVFIDVVQDTEARRLLFDLGQLLLVVCHWRVAVGQDAPLSLLPDGVTITYAPDKDSTRAALRAAKAISEYLNLPEVAVQNDLSALDSKHLPDWWPQKLQPPPKGTICVFIGLRPVGERPRNWFHPERP